MSEVTLDVDNLEESFASENSDPFEPDDEVTENADDEDSSEDEEEDSKPKLKGYSKRVRQLNAEKNRLSEENTKLQQQINQLIEHTKQLHSMINQQNEGSSNSQTSQTPSQEIDSESELLIQRLGGDDAAKDLYTILQRIYDTQAKNSKLVNEDRVKEMLDAQINEKFSTQAAVDACVKRLDQLRMNGTLDDKERDWVAANLVEITKREPRWLGNAQSARILINHIVQEGLEAGKITKGTKNLTGRTSPIGAGDGRVGEKPVSNRNIRESAQKFRSLKNLPDKKLKQLVKGINFVAGNGNQMAITGDMVE